MSKRTLQKKLAKLEILSESFYTRDVRKVAIDLLGKYIVHEIRDTYLITKIVETEAYLGEIDPACHLYGGKQTERTSAFYQGPGTIYVYLIYGIHHCLNVITETAELIGGVLIRAGEPINGIEVMQQYRNGQSGRNLTNGPGKLTEALQITIDHNKTVAYAGDLTIREKEDEDDPSAVCSSPRIGISQATQWNLRYFLQNNPYVSKHKLNKTSQVLDSNQELGDISKYTSNPIK